jgi:molybdopterin-guanine dinucleotide biosynthesis protein A
MAGTMAGTGNLLIAAWVYTSLGARVVTAQDAPRDTVQQERVYASAVATLADSAIHRLDFFPARAQLRVQTAFLSAQSEATSVPFAELAAIGAAAALAIDEGAQRFKAVAVPADLTALHGALVSSLSAATRAADRLAAAASACQASMMSIERCQTPFAAASSRLLESYKAYLAARSKIGSQILDTQTHLAEFKVAAR